MAGDHPTPATAVPPSLTEKVLGQIREMKSSTPTSEPVKGIAPGIEESLGDPDNSRCLAYDLAAVISEADTVCTTKDRGYWFDLYAKCLSAVSGNAGRTAANGHVAFAMTKRIIPAERQQPVKQGELRDAQYWLDLYKECLETVNGPSSESEQRRPAFR